VQRRLIRLYDRHLAAVSRAAVPVSLRAAITGALYRATRHPDLGFRHVQQLRRMGQDARALALYAAPGAGPDALDDPLLDAVLTPRGTPLTDAEFGYRGLWIGGRAPGEWVEFRLDGAVLRRERLRGRAAFRYIVGRQALALFPPQALLEVVDDADRVLGAYDVRMPDGQGGIAAAIDRLGPLEKKGGLRPDAAMLEGHHAAYLALYARVRDAFEAEFGIPLLILYGTLLGQHRSGSFIPGDDDFDVGYVSDQTAPDALRAQAARMIEALVARGFEIALNAEGKPFRIRDAAAPPGLWLDNRPVFAPGDGHVWLHKQARLQMDLADFTPVKAWMNGTEVLKPRATETFLAQYYGPGWRVPDPGFSNASKAVPSPVIRGLRAVNFSRAEQRSLAQRIAARHLPGRFAPMALQWLYPLTAE